MDKQFALCMIAFFSLCAILVTWAAIGAPKRDKACYVVAYGYAALMWACIITLTILTVLY